MKLLREYIRTLLEFEAGEKLWPVYAKDGSRHKGLPSFQGGERDTKQERELRDMIKNHLENGTEDTGDRLSSKQMSRLKRAALDDRYSDVVTYYQGPVYRGIAVGTDWMDNYLPEDWRDMEEFYPRAKSNPPAKVNINYETRIGGNVESWTKNPKEAEGFALENMDSDYYIYGIVMKSEASGNRFIDLHGLISQYSPSLFDSSFVSEQEVITNHSTIPVTEIQVVSFAKDYHDGY